MSTLFEIQSFEFPSTCMAAIPDYFYLLFLRFRTSVFINRKIPFFNRRSELVFDKNQSRD